MVDSFRIMQMGLKCQYSFSEILFTLRDGVHTALDQFSNFGIQMIFDILAATE